MIGRAQRLLLLDRSFGLFWSAQTVSTAGDAFRQMAVLLSVYEISGHSGPAVAMLAIAWLAPSIALGPIAGAVADRHGQRLILIRADVIRCMLSLALIPAVLVRSMEGIYAIVAISAAVSIFAYPAQYALLPRVVDKGDLQRANALLVAGDQAAGIVGPPAATGAFFLWGPASVLAFDAASFLVSAVALASMGGGGSAADSSAASAGPRSRGTWLDTLAGLRYIVATPLLLANALTLSGMSIAAGLTSTAMIFFISNDLGRSASEVAWTYSANGVAQVLMSAVITAMAGSLRPQLVLVVGASLLALGAGISASAVSLPVLLVGVLVMALGNAPFNIARATVEQEFVAGDYLGRARGSLDVLGSVLFLGAAGIAGFLVSSLGARFVLAVSAATLASVLAVTVFMVVPIVVTLRSGSKA